MKKLLLLSLLSAIGTSTFAASGCSIYYRAEDKLTTIIKEKPFDFANYDVVCQRLKNANAIVSLTYISSITNEQTTVSVTATVSDINLPIESGLSRNRLYSSQERTTTEENELFMDAVNDALNSIDQSDIDGLNVNRKKLGFKTYPASANINKK